MSEINVMPELKQIIGALLFAAREPVALETIKKALKDVAKNYEGPVQDFAKVSEEDIHVALKQLNDDLSQHHTGIHVGEVANGYRLQNDLSCGLWIRTMLEKGRSNRLSKPALETLAIIAYRQPCTRSEIEAVRGVAVDAIMKNLMELQLVKAVGRSELPGRPWLFATTQKFLEYFGLKDIADLPGVDELRRMEKAQSMAKRNEAIAAATEEEIEVTAVESPENGEQNEEVEAAVSGEDSLPADAEEQEIVHIADEDEDDTDDEEYEGEDDLDEEDDEDEEEYDDEDEDEEEDEEEDDEDEIDDEDDTEDEKN